MKREENDLVADVADELLAEYEFRKTVERYVDPHPDWEGHMGQAVMENLTCCLIEPRPDEYTVSGGSGSGRGLRIGDPEYMSFSELKKLYSD